MKKNPLRFLKIFFLIMYSDMVTKGRVVVLNDKIVDYINIKVDNSETELDKLRFSFECAIKYLETNKNIEQIDDSYIISDIFETQIFLLKESEIFNDIANTIKSEKCTAQYAIKLTLENYKGLFSKIDDDLKSRYIDIESVCSLILNMLDERYINLEFNEKVILAGNTIPAFLLIKNIRNVVGCISSNDSFNSHTSLICRERNIAYLTDIKIENGWDQKNGEIDVHTRSFKVECENVHGKILSPLVYYNYDLNSLKKLFKVNLTVNSLEILNSIDYSSYNGIGLVRTELLVLESVSFISLESQIEKYRKLSETMENKKVSIRLFDFGDDKPFPSFLDTEKPNNNLRGIRYLLTHLDILQTQLEAVIRGNINNNLRILIPFVSTVDEIMLVKKTLADIAERNSLTYNIELGAMIETPSSVFLIEDIIKVVDFITIGTNDLLHSLYLTDRASKCSFNYMDKEKKALVNAIRYITEVSHKNQKKVCICGESIYNNNMVPIMNQIGIDEISLSPAINSYKE